QNLRNQIITQKVIGQEVGSHLNITKEEEQKFYEEHKGEMEQPEQIRLSEILVAVQKPAAPKPANDPVAPIAPINSEKTPETAPASGATLPAVAAIAPASIVSEEELLNAAETKANGLLEQIKKGAAFDDVAKKSSDGPSAGQGGDLGLFKRGTLSKELEDR